MKLGTNLLVAVGFALVVVGACSNDESGDGQTGGRGASSGSGTESGGGTNGNGAEPGTSGGASTGGASGSGTTGGRNGGGRGGEGGDVGGSIGMGGDAGGSQGGDGPSSDEPTAEDVCNVICPRGDRPGFDFVEDLCPPPPASAARLQLGTGGAGDGGPGDGGEAGAPDGYDRAGCIRDCLAYPDVHVPPLCGDESMLYWRCMLDPSNYICLPTGGTEENLCNPLEIALGLCWATYERADAVPVTAR